MENKITHIGFYAILPFFAAIIGAVIFLYTHSFKLGLTYDIGICVSLLLILYAYCAKCPCRLKLCSHVVLGPLTRFLPKRQAGPYTFWDYGAVAAAFLFMLLFPQIVLIKHGAWMIAFWLLMGLSVYLIFGRTCEHCYNKQCGIRALVFGTRRTK